MSTGKANVMPPVMILCGGQGTRLREVTELLPKPMVPIGNYPIVWHIMRSYAAFGAKRFILCLGYKREAFIDYFLNFRARQGDITVKLGGRENDVVFHDKYYESDWEVTLADTGVPSKTATRIRIASKYLGRNDRDFFLTYGDGVSDVNMKELLQFHRKSGKALTISAVHPEGRYGEIDFHSDQSVTFNEKPFRLEGYINGGFMVMQKSAVAEYIPADRDEFFEAEPIAKIIAAKDLNAYRHEGFWQCMDTPHENALLNSLWDSGSAPWTKYW